MASRSTPPPEDVHKLAELSNVTADTIFAVLRDRFFSALPYTRLSDSILISVNPFAAPGNRNSDDTLREYTKDYRETSKANRVRNLPPHIFATACNAYFYMRRTGQDQSILFAGETASGKTELRRLAIRTLVDLSAPPPGKKGSKLAVQVPSGEFILESLGNARTLENGNASRFGKYTELQFSESGRLVGSKTLDYYLEKTRVFSCAGSERNFHVFHYLVAGATEEEKEFLHITDAAAFRYLGSQRGHRETAREDAARFNRLKQAFKNVGLSKRQVASICQVLAAILHLGNLDFYQDRHSTQDSASIRNPEVLNVVAGFLGVASKELSEVLTYKTRLIKNEVCTILLDSDGAAANRDDLAKSLYSLLFAWLNEHINEKLCKDDFDTFVGLFDLPGFQNLSRANSLDQFCINYANEATHGYMLRTVFEKTKAEYSDEGITYLSPDVPYFDNAETLRLINNQPGGLVHIMDDQARRMPKKTDHTMAEAFGKRWGNHPTFKVGPADRSGFSTFTISHFAGPVTYSCEGLLEKNAEVVSPDFVSMLRGQQVGAGKSASDVQGGQSAGSTVAFIRSLFSTRALKTQAHPKSEQTIVAAQQSVKPIRQPSMRRTAKGSGTIRRAGTQRRGGNLAPGGEEDSDEDAEAEGEGGAGAAKKTTARFVAGEFRSALDTLFETLDETKAWFVLALRPNDNQLPNQFEARVVKQQVKTLAIAEMSRKTLNEYCVSMTPEEFCERYADAPSLSAASMRGASGGEAKQKFAAAKDIMGWADAEAAAGRVKVFLSHEAFRELEDELRAADPEEVRANERKALIDADAAAKGETDPFSPLGVLEEGAHGVPDSPGLVGAYGDPFKERSQAAVPLVGGEDAMDDAKSAFSEMTGPGAFLSRRSYGGGFSTAAPSVIGSEAYAPSRNMFADAGSRGADEKGGAGFTAPDAGLVREEHGVSSTRRRWVAFTWLLTFWIPSPVLSLVGGLKRPDIRMAWREKLAINMAIWFVCGCAIFVIAVLGNLICPKEHVYSQDEFSNHKGDDAFTAIRGEVFDLNGIARFHRTQIPVVGEKVIMAYAGEDATNIFPVQVNALCNGETGQVSPWVQLSGDNTTLYPNAQYHDFRAVTQDIRPDWYYESMWLMRSNYRVGFMGYTPDGINDMLDSGRSIVIYRGGVYDFTQYIAQGRRGVPEAPPGQQAPADTNLQFMSNVVIDLAVQNPGKDITASFDQLGLSSEVLDRQRVCMRNLFFIGKQDGRNSPRCQFSRYLLLALSIFMISIIGFKFLAALQFGRVRKPEDHDKFVLCQVPCYTEGEESMRKTIDSLAALKYDDKRKLLFVICDGNIVGAGNDRPTPRIVLDILGADPSLEPEALSFLSLGEGARQHNMAKVYSGLYEHAGHVVPYVVVVKCGKPTERQRPGNRGKRDSQLVLMRFLNKVHFGLPMNPMELEVYHQIKNVIGVNPSFYEYILQVDADTEVEAYSLNRFISAFTNDKRVIGLCGETALSNSKKSFITMLQVYEYYISHYMAKAFESLFGSVTCLPGCFSMFRIRTPDTHRPLFIANSVVDEYAENRVDTLHTKNLLHLGEDRYLTTLVLKHFNNYKTIFVRDAKAKTTAPEEWGVLLSQRRRWINSTVHNLFELLSGANLCGFCLFSMRFVVFIDLLSTIIAPVTVVYIVYLIYLVATDSSTVPLTSIIMLVAIYGLQAIIFLLNRKFEMVIWMLIYLIATPIWSLFLPLYSFWHMDDFSWGSTRVVVGESGKRVVMHDEGVFDPSSIPLQTWAEYENELWERNSARSIGSIIEAARKEQSQASRAGSQYTPSLYGQPLMMHHQQSFGHSPTASAYGGGGGGPGSAMGGYFPPGDARQSTYTLNQMPAAQPYAQPAGHASGYGTPAGMSMYGAPAGYMAQPQVAASPGYAGTPSMYGAMGGYGAPQSMYGAPVMSQIGMGNARASSYSLSGEAALVDTRTPGQLPSDDTIARDIRDLIANADLQTITKKKLRQQLEQRYGVPVDSKKAFVNQQIDECLAMV
ncbi:chitin synthase 8 [Ceraceosorus guamensis]|uniref:chitin synthase n=1 Tax=Ceraceosorus guamensis TaxID=1522189 RepID=A0A316W619_9BASI|nr:chitin synthase 8 [Ceraceosorus guamensis]PWN45202.1 chitin synthase 8 [Ceraceosorus guamensis]